MSLLENYFTWKEPKISNWRKILRIIFVHGWYGEIDIRGVSAIEGAKRLMERHKNDLKPDELEFVEGILK